jgi:hypothetical protein
MSRSENIHVDNQSPLRYLDFERFRLVGFQLNLPPPGDNLRLRHFEGFWG